ncbi:MAG: hypothetical protein IKV96_02965 [Firmicutes bacterium]|nr:hypothetical protein [Bacillota bacterium]
MGNVLAFHGSDRKSGVTMTSLAVCQELVKMHPEKTVLLLCLNSRSGAEYLSEETCSIEDLRLHIVSRTLTAEELKMRCRYKDGFYVVTGLTDSVVGREYLPEMSEYLIGVAKEQFDFVVCDTGSDLDDGLALGAMTGSDKKYMVISQCESGLKGYEQNEWLYEKLGINFDRILINRFFPADPYDIDYISERLGRTKDMFHIIRTAGYCRQAEIDHKSLLEYRNDNYRVDINSLAEYISRQAGYRDSLERKRRLWRIGSI